MKIQCSQNLIRLAEQFEKADSVLYIVGGCVRNYFLNLPSSDIDICGSLLAEDVKKICKSLDYKCETINKNLGTVLIKVENEELEKFLKLELEKMSAEKTHNGFYEFIPFEDAIYNFNYLRRKLETYQAKTFFSEKEKESHEMFLRLAMKKAQSSGRW